MKAGDSLDHLGSAILHRLLKRQWAGDGNLATVTELLDALAADKSLGHLESRTVKRSLDRLKRDGFVTSAKAPRPMNHSGPTPTGYRSAPDLKLICRKSTAQIVLRLLHHPGRPVPEEAFMAEIEGLNLCPDNTAVPLTADDLRNQLEWCINQGYIERCESANDPENPGKQPRLFTTSKVDSESLFLNRICERKGPASADRTLTPVSKIS
jgi:hypothetical protein